MEKYFVFGTILIFLYTGALGPSAGARAGLSKVDFKYCIKELNGQMSQISGPGQMALAKRLNVFDPNKLRMAIDFCMARITRDNYFSKAEKRALNSLFLEISQKILQFKVSDNFPEFKKLIRYLIATSTEKKQQIKSKIDSAIQSHEYANNSLSLSIFYMDVLLGFGELDSVRVLLSQLERLCEQGTEEYYRIRYRMASLYLLLGDYAKAEPMFNEALGAGKLTGVDLFLARIEQVVLLRETSRMVAAGKALLATEVALDAREKKSWKMARVFLEQAENQLAVGTETASQLMLADKAGDLFATQSPYSMPFVNLLRAKIYRKSGKLDKATSEIHKISLSKADLDKAPFYTFFFHFEAAVIAFLKNDKKEFERVQTQAAVETSASKSSRKFMTLFKPMSLKMAGRPATEIRKSLTDLKSHFGSYTRAVEVQGLVGRPSS